ncbi:MAG: lysozyme inhibitor LprI family protein [Cyanobacteria bacterium P01_G01_bin.38]
MTQQLTQYLNRCKILSGAMLTVLATPAAVFAEAVPGVAKPVCLDQGQQSLNDCAIRWHQVTAYFHQLTEEAVAASLSEEQQLRLEQIEQTWRRYRVLLCEATSEPLEDGAAYPMVFYNCMAQVTNDRIANLQGWGIPDMAYEVSEAEMIEAENSSLVGDLKQIELQMIWRRYRNAHCEFVTEYAASQFFSDDFSLETCRSRLNEERLAHLETYFALR